MSAESDLNPDLKKAKIKSCRHTVGTTECQNCVTSGNCPSNIKTIEQIDKIEKGKNHCYGQS